MNELTTISDVQTNLDTTWILIAAALVMLMQAGFTALESGLTRAKNTINVAMKNITDFVASVLVFWLCGYGIMFGVNDGWFSGLFGLTGFGLNGFDSSTDHASFVFQAIFAGTAATIVSGAIAERMQFKAYAFVAVFTCAIIYPVSGHWIWNGEGWLAQKGFMDFAGSTVVHSLGAWVGLAGAILLGPRIGRFNASGEARNIQGHSLVLAVVGVIILWFGWFGFNGGSELAADQSVPTIVMNTLLSAAAGGFSCFMTAMFTKQGSGGIPVEKMLNGVVGGLVAITAGCALASPGGAILMGVVGGVLVYFAEEVIVHVFKIDDPVNFVAGHGIAGAWGTIGIAFIAPESALVNGSVMATLGVQTLGVVSVFAWGFGLGLVLFGGIKKLGFLRVSPEAEEMGLNIHEHGAISGFLETMRIMHEIGQAQNGGTADLRKRIPVEEGTDNGELAKIFNHFLDNYEKTISQLQSQAKALEVISTNMGQCSSSLSETAEVQSQSMTEVMSAQLDVADGARNIVASSETMSIVASETLEKTSSLNHEFQQSVDMSSQILDAMLGAQTHVNELTQSTKEVWGILDTIKSLADQTNLLALNASIEAARAGDLGRGFSVVADEVRMLSNRTQIALQEIAAIITKLSSSAEGACDAVYQSQGLAQDNSSVIESFKALMSDIECALGLLSESNNSVSQLSMQQDSQVSFIQSQMQKLEEGTTGNLESVRINYHNAGRISEIANGIRVLADRFTVSGEDTSGLYQA